MLSDRIQDVMKRIGLNHFPQDADAPIEHGSLDSLMLALLIIELESEFNIKIPVIPLVKAHYETLSSIETHLISLRAK